MNLDEWELKINTDFFDTKKNWNRDDGNFRERKVNCSLVSQHFRIFLFCVSFLFEVSFPVFCYPYFVRVLWMCSDFLSFLSALIYRDVSEVLFYLKVLIYRQSLNHLPWIRNQPKKSTREFLVHQKQVVRKLEVVFRKEPKVLFSSFPRSDSVGYGNMTPLYQPQPKVFRLENTSLQELSTL